MQDLHKIRISSFCDEKQRLPQYISLIDRFKNFNTFENFNSIFFLAECSLSFKRLQSFSGLKQMLLLFFFSAWLPLAINEWQYMLSWIFFIFECCCRKFVFSWYPIKYEIEIYPRPLWLVIMSHARGISPCSRDEIRPLDWLIPL